ncbi:hypothetical protein EJ02DRAFT_458281 [Clathrospora elynae]|uniref:Uncharacterized protein n=1 Tax=Clathrospora elynae TaxID=706981 RepID=A0A6A5SE32_9PLEO|nr:hypothetical protein EJ02DRAFT_458281 [Clathrospora elynae]
MQNNLIAESLHAVEREGARAQSARRGKSGTRGEKAEGGEEVWLHKTKYIAHGAMYE